MFQTVFINCLCIGLIDCDIMLFRILLFWGQESFEVEDKGEERGVGIRAVDDSWAAL